MIFLNVRLPFYFHGMAENPHISRLLRCIQLEEKAQISRYRLDQHHGLRQLKAEGLALHPISITHKSFGYADYPELSFRLRFPAETGAFRDGTAIECFLPGEESVKGILINLDGSRGEFRLLAPDFPDWIEEDAVGIKLAPDTRTSTIMKKAMESIQAKQELLTLFEWLHPEKPAPAHLPVFADSHIDFQNPHLNPSQQQAVAAILENERLCIIHGPPGTGKTTTLVEAAIQLVRRGERILISAPSNAAVDHLSKGLIRLGVKLLRVGNINRVDETVFAHTPEGILSGSRRQKEIRQLRMRADEFRRMAHKYKRRYGRAEREQRNLLFKEVKSILAEIRNIQAYEEEKLFANAEIIAGTPVGLYDTDLRGQEFRSLLIDEAGQCLEPLAWSIIPLAEKIVLAGDPWQLPPTVISPEAAAMGFAKSILESAIDSPFPVLLLDTQYRMREAIAAFSNSWFYDSRLKSAPGLENYADHLVFIDTAGAGYEESIANDGFSLHNPGELDLIQKLLKEDQPPEGGTAFISPYAGQVNLARERLPAGMRVSTIDSFQGQEEETVFISLVRSNDEAIIGFLKDYRRMNVALTRAKEKLVVVGDSATLAKDPFFRSFLEYAEKYGKYRSAWEWEDV